VKRLHVSLKVADLEDAIAFYSTLFAAEPTMRKPDYAKWMLEDPRVNFSIVADGRGGAGIEHLGIQAESPEELEELRARIARTQGRVVDAGETTCCYHDSDKSWVTDAQGVSWEAFYTSGEAAKRGFAAKEAPAALEEMRTLPGLRVSGLMTMAPFTDDERPVRACFAGLRELRDALPFAEELPVLSMGMKNDFEIAVEEGATLVRVGTAIFG